PPQTYTSRGEAFEAVKKDLRIPDNAVPRTDTVPMTDSNGHVVNDAAGNVIHTREYEYTLADGRKVYIQDHSAGHAFGDPGGVGDQGPHFNVRPEDPTNPGRPLRNGTVP